jgi:hypothetical protein
MDNINLGAIQKGFQEHLILINKKSHSFSRELNSALTRIFTLLADKTKICCHRAGVAINTHSRFINEKSHSFSRELNTALTRIINLVAAKTKHCFQKIKK